MIPGTRTHLDQYIKIDGHIFFFYLPTPRTPLSTHLPTVDAGGGTG